MRGRLAQNLASDAAEYARFVQLSNKGARELGFKDTGAMWRVEVRHAAGRVRAELDRLWEQVEPLYVSLHAYVREQLSEKYGNDVVPPDGPIPAHLLGNMWAQEWGNIYPLVAPADADPGYDLTEMLEDAKRRRSRHGALRRDASSLRWASRRCRRHSGSARCSSSRATAKWSATPAPGTSTTKTTCG